MQKVKQLRKFQPIIKLSVNVMLNAIVKSTDRSLAYHLQILFKILQTFQTVENYMIRKNI